MIEANRPALDKMIERQRAKRAAQESRETVNFSKLSRQEQSELLRRSLVESRARSLSEANSPKLASRASSTSSPEKSPVRISRLVAQLSRTQVTTDDAAEMRGFLNGLNRQAEMYEPGNPFSQSVTKAIELLDQGVKPSQLSKKLRELGL
ncbi:MAG: hypothetical protein KJS97_16470 [Alphaproteobacteria bacterium]|nr:hypothetical protein [Alphaproteobacteria bacterium]